MRVRRAVLFLLVLAFHSWRSDTQLNPDAVGSVEGTVADPTGAVIARAEVTATNESTQQQASAITDSSGSYRFSLPPGSYRMRFAMQGFKTVTRTSVSVTASHATRSDIRLAVGGGSSVEIASIPSIPEDGKNQVSAVMNGGSHVFDSPRTLESGTMGGSVIDRHGIPIGGVRVRAREKAKGMTYVTTTTCAGKYEFVNLFPGTYALEFTKSGFRSGDRRSVRVNPRESVLADGKLRGGKKDNTRKPCPLSELIGAR